MRKRISLIAALSLLAGCSSSPLQVVDADRSAKIRVFHGTSIYMHPGQICYGAKNQKTIHAAAGGFSLMAANKKVGMPVTDDMPWSYHEYIIPANQPLTLEMSWATEGAGIRQSCGPVGATFIPEIGKYYDTSMLFAKGRCSVQLRELIEDSPGKVSTIIKTTTPAFACPKS